MAKPESLIDTLALEREMSQSLRQRYEVWDEWSLDNSLRNQKVCVAATVTRLNYRKARSSPRVELVTFQRVHQHISVLRSSRNFEEGSLKIGDFVWRSHDLHPGNRTLQVGVNWIDAENRFADSQS